MTIVIERAVGKSPSAVKKEAKDEPTTTPKVKEPVTPVATIEPTE